MVEFLCCMARFEEVEVLHLLLWQVAVSCDSVVLQGLSCQESAWSQRPGRTRALVRAGWGSKDRRARQQPLRQQPLRHQPRVHAVFVARSTTAGPTSWCVV